MEKLTEKEREILRNLIEEYGYEYDFDEEELKVIKKLGFKAEEITEYTYKQEEYKKYM